MYEILICFVKCCCWIWFSKVNIFGFLSMLVGGLCNKKRFNFCFFSWCKFLCIWVKICWGLKFVCLVVCCVDWIECWFLGDFLISEWINGFVVWRRIGGILMFNLVLVYMISCFFRFVFNWVIVCLELFWL